MHLIIPKDYNPVLNTRDTEIAIKLVKDFFERELARQLNLTRVSAPIMVTPQSGLNDNLNGVERPVSFDIPDVGATGQVVHSLAKWKRLALKRYDFKPGKGLFTDMNAIRRDEEVDNLHSIYVDQWDWEKVIERQDRNEQYLRQTVRAIVSAVVETIDALQIAFPCLLTAIGELLERARGAGVTQALVGNLGHVALARLAGMEARGDFGLNIFNSYALELAKAAMLRSATASFEQYGELSLFGHFANDLSCFGVSGYGAQRDVDNDVGSVFPRTTGSAAGLSVFGKDVALVLQVNQGPILLVPAKNDAASVSSVTAVGTSEFDEFLFSEVS